ncbi:MAG: hypothetical protein HYW07_10535 [Candidatus Latescibacteria bacterium]|nr:hypothetical protein [Candidatus Latescibacterota bacterium]
MGGLRRTRRISRSPCNKASRWLLPTPVGPISRVDTRLSRLACSRRSSVCRPTVWRVVRAGGWSGRLKKRYERLRWRENQRAKPERWSSRSTASRWCSLLTEM